jgi:hypothetical protein
MDNTVDVTIPIRTGSGGGACGRAHYSASIQARLPSPKLSPADAATIFISKCFQNAL